MGERESIQKALSYLHASSGTLEEVMKMIDKEEKKQLRQQRRHSLRQVRRTALIAAALAVLLTTTALAVALSRVDLVVEEYNVPATAGNEAIAASDVSDEAGEDLGFSYEADSSGGTSRYDITFMPVDDEYIELGYWYPETLPEGFEESFVSEHWRQAQTVHYENEAGDHITYNYGIAGDWFMLSVAGINDIQEVTINGNHGKVFVGDPAEHAGCYDTTIVWTDAERGLGFVLDYYGQEQIDLLAMAQSVTERGESPTPTLSTAYDEALEELGSYVITDLPEGYERTEFYASPTSQGGGWYGYVRMTFENAEHKTIYLGYETVGYSDDATGEEIADMVFPEPGMQATPGGVTWYIEGVGPKLGLKFVMTADEISGDELLALAQSVTLQE